MSHTPQTKEGTCELCGRAEPLETHHKVPIVCDGTDDPDNKIRICSTCHGKLTPKRLLIKLGVERAKSRVRLAVAFHELVLLANEKQKWGVDVLDVLDIFDKWYDANF